MSETVTFKMNDRDLTVPKGWTVMRAAKEHGVYIPHFCWHPGLTIAGVCRFCMVKVSGRPKLEIACNLQATEGMEVSTLGPEVKEAHKWALEFHLVNHPLDCPICDQAGECGLQDYYMKVGRYNSQMTRPKVLKPKALKVGEELLLDTERCILCSRCVRFEEEVTKTGALGIFSRGDRSIIGTYPDKKIDHNYQTNLVDICPVGAFTSKDFRFKQRVWFLKEKPAVCPGCSTGCHVDVHAKPQMRQYFRLKPRESEVNGFWMCDKGRDTYEHLNPAHRLRFGVVTEEGKHKNVKADSAIRILADKLKGIPADEIGLLVSAQYTCEEYEDLFAYFVKDLGVKKVFQWREPTEDRAAFDGLLYRGDHNANTNGLMEAMEDVGLKRDVKDEFDGVATSGVKVLIAIAPELPSTFPSLAEQLGRLGELPFVSLWSVTDLMKKNPGLHHGIPLAGFAEKSGTFLNHEGKEGNLKSPYPPAVEDARTVTEVVRELRAWMKSPRP